MEMDAMYEQLGIEKRVLEFGKEIEEHLSERFAAIDETAEYNQLKVIKAMQDNRVSDIHFAATTGYGYNDLGRDTLEDVYASVFHTESALVRPGLISGTHALHVALSGNLRPGDELLSPVGKPYDTLEEVIGIRESTGSLKDDLHDAVCGIIGEELRIATAVFHTGNPIQGVIGIGHGAGSIRHGGEVAIGIVGIAGHNALGIGLALDIACQIIGECGRIALGIGDLDDPIPAVVLKAGNITQSIRHGDQAPIRVIGIGGLRTLFIHGLYHTTICVIGIVCGIAFGIGAGDCSVQSIVGIAGGIAVTVSRGNRISLVIILEGEGIALRVGITGKTIQRIIDISSGISFGIDSLDNVPVMIVLRAGHAAIGVRNGNSAAKRIIGIAGRIAVGVCNRGYISCFVVLMQFHISTIKKNSLLFQIGNG